MALLICLLFSRNFKKPMNKEEQIRNRHFHDLANRAYNRGVPIFSEFLTLNEVSILKTIEKELSYVKVQLWGGYEEAERQIAAFVPDAFFPTQDMYPISILKISPLNVKFSEQLTHRDYLGAILNLGIQRGKVGDILVNDKETYLFVSSSMVDLFTMELTRVKHTTVKTEPVTEAVRITPKFQHMEGSVSSERIDAILSLAFQTSRSSIAPLIASEKVFVNGKITLSNSQILKPGDIISARGYGKFIYRGFISNTKKGRMFVALDRYA